MPVSRPLKMSLSLRSGLMQPLDMPLHPPLAPDYLVALRCFGRLVLVAPHPVHQPKVLLHRQVKCENKKGGLTEDAAMLHLLLV